MEMRVGRAKVTQFVQALGMGLVILSIAACANHSPLPKVIKLTKMTNSLGQTIIQPRKGDIEAWNSSCACS
jgi:hypothetical protein